MVPEANVSKTKLKEGGGISVQEVVTEADRTWLSTVMDKFLLVSHVAPEGAAEDAAFRARLTEASRDAGKLLTAVRARKRSVRRRTSDTATQALADAEEVETKCNLLCDFLRLLLRPSTSADAGNTGDIAYSKLVPLMDVGARFSPPVFRQVAKMMWADDLRWKRWDSMFTVTYKFLSRVVDHDSAGGENAAFMTQNMNVIFQKLVKATPVEDAACLN